MKPRKIKVEYYILKDDEVLFNHQVPFSNKNQPYYLTIPNIKFDAFVINFTFLEDVSYFHIGLNCEDIKFAYKHFKNMKMGSSFEVGSFIPYEKGYRFFPNTSFLTK